MRQGTGGRSAVKRGDRSVWYYLDRIGADRRIMPDDINKSAVVSLDGAGGQTVERMKQIEEKWEHDMQQSMWPDDNRGCKCSGSTRFD